MSWSVTSCLWQGRHAVWKHCCDGHTFFGHVFDGRDAEASDQRARCPLPTQVQGFIKWLPLDTVGPGGPCSPCRASKRRDVFVSQHQRDDERSARQETSEPRNFLRAVQ